jgi:FtsP/CotA-like multicopper oxidase with cupredoxin domain
MLIRPLDIFVHAWLVVAILSAAYVAWDQFRGNPEPVVMKWGFVLVTLYMGPIGLLLYVMADKEPSPGTHEEFIKPLWKQGVGSTVHCVAGDATGIIVAAVVVALIGLPMWQDLIVEYVAGFMFGLLIFQALFMRKMMGGTYLQNVRRSFLPELISMNCMMAGMAPVMVALMMGRDMRAMWPGEPLFWVVMSLGIVAGFAIAYPVNVWMVSRGMKHGLMTERDPMDTPAASGMKPMRKPAKLSVSKTKTKHDTDAGAPAMSTDTSMKGMEGMDHGAGAMKMPVSPATKRRGSGEQPAGHGGHGQAAGAGGAEAMKANVTRPQLVAVAMFTALMLVVGMTFPATFYNLTLSAEEVGGAIMPPGMIMDNDTPAAAMLDMAAVDPRDVTKTVGLDTRGARELAPRIEKGVKVFDLETSVIRWQILPKTWVNAYAFNGQVPGPTLRFKQGDRVRINVTNHLPESTTVHWHGLILPNVMDGPANVTQDPIKNGGTYRYEFTAVQSGTYFYHSHDHVDRQQALGLYGALLIEPAVADPSLAADHEYTLQLQEWLMREGLTYPAMPMEGGMPNYFTINGRAFPSTDTIHMKVGETVKVRFVGSNSGFIHPMHIHGGPFQVVARDGETLAPAQRFLADTINVGPGQRYDVIWKALKPGKWMIHCHISHHTTNNNAETDGGGGLMMHIEVEGDPRT